MPYKREHSRMDERIEEHNAEIRAEGAVIERAALVAWLRSHGQHGITELLYEVKDESALSAPKEYGHPYVVCPDELADAIEKRLHCVGEYSTQESETT